MNKDLISKHIESLHESIIDLQNRIIPLEVKNDSDKLHEKINKDEEFLNNCEGVIFRDNLTPLNINKEWINLDIDNLPERFFTRDDIEIDGQHPLTSIWISLENYSEDARKGVLNLSKLWGIKYRYRIIQENKESIRIKSLVMQSDGIMKAVKEDGSVLMIEIID